MVTFVIVLSEISSTVPFFSGRFVSCLHLEHPLKYFHDTLHFCRTGDDNVLHGVIHWLAKAVILCPSSMNTL